MAGRVGGTDALGASILDTVEVSRRGIQAASMETDTTGMPHKRRTDLHGTMKTWGTTEGIDVRLRTLTHEVRVLCREMAEERQRRSPLTRERLPSARKDDR